MSETWPIFFAILAFCSRPRPNSLGSYCSVMADSVPSRGADLRVSSSHLLRIGDSCNKHGCYQKVR